MQRSLDGVIRRPVVDPESTRAAVKPQPKPKPPQAPKSEAPRPAAANGVAELSRVRKVVTILVLSLALAIIVIDTTLLNVSLKYIIHDLHTDIQSLQWVITAYALTLAALTITGGRLGDLWGRKKMFVAGAVLFAAGSLIASFSTRLGMLVAGEAIIEGVGAALMMPATASLLLASFRGRQRALAFGIWGGVAAASSAIGPIVGGYLTTHYSWRWGFRINVGVAALLVLGSVLIRDSRDTAERPQLDLLGVLLSATGLLSVVFGIIKSSDYGWFKALKSFAIFGHNLNDISVLGHSLGSLSITFWTLIVGLVLLVLFTLWQSIRERRGRTPLVSLGLFKIQQFTSGVLTVSVLSLAMIGLIFVLPVFLQAVRGLDALHTGLALLPMSLAMLVMGPLSAFMTKHIAPKRLIQAGLLFNVVAILVLRHSMSLDATARTLAPGLLIFGVGMGLAMAQLSNLTLSAVSVQQAGEASGVNNTFRQVGSSLGTAIIGAVLIGQLAKGVSNGVNASRVIPDRLKAQISVQASAQASNVAFGADSNEGDLPSAIRNELTRIGHEAVVDGAKKALGYGAIFAALGFLLAARLPAHRDVETGEAAVTPAAGH